MISELSTEVSSNENNETYKNPLKEESSVTPASSGSITTNLQQSTSNTTTSPITTNSISNNPAANTMGTEELNLPVQSTEDQTLICDWTPQYIAAAPNRKKGWPRGRKRRCLPKDAPKAPLSGYMLYMAEQRELLRHSDSPPTFAELAKIVAHKWAALEISDKQKYLDASEVEKERYQKELSAYTLTDSYKHFMQQQELQVKQQPHGQQRQIPAQRNTASQPQQNGCPPHDDVLGQQQGSKKQRKDVQQMVSPVNSHTSNSSVTKNDSSLKVDEEEDEVVNYTSALKIPIFSDQFLRHNRGGMESYYMSNGALQPLSPQQACHAREAELRQMRKSNSNCEEQNALLQKHIESIRLGVDKLEGETIEIRKKSAALTEHLTKLRADLAVAFENTPAPGWSSPPTPASVDDYLVSLHAALTASPPAPQSRAMHHAVQQMVTALVLN